MTRSFAALLLAALAVGCVDAVGPVTSNGASIDFAFVSPQGVSEAETAAIREAFGTVDSYSVTIVESTTLEMIVDTVVPANQVDEAHVLDIRIPDAALGRTVTITLVAYDLFFGSDPDALELYRSVTTTTLDAVAGGRIRVDLEVRYTGPGIRGTVRDEAGNGVGGVTVELERDSVSVVTATTEPDGSYLFADPSFDLVAGTYVVRPQPPASATICPLNREVSVTTDEAILANFRVQTEVCGSKVLLLSGGDYDDNDLVATHFVDNPTLEVASYFFINQLPTLDYLSQFDVVLVYMNGLFDESASLGDRVAEYVALGGNVVVTSFYFQGRSDSGLGSVGWGALENIDPFTATGGGATYSEVFLEPTSILTHPITNGISFLGSLLYSSGVEAKAGTFVLASWTDGAPLVGYRTLSSGQRIVGVSLFPGAGDTATGDVTTLWNNAVGWAGEAGGPG
jgi:hypothetical protein